MVTHTKDLKRRISCEYYQFILIKMTFQTLDKRNAQKKSIKNKLVTILAGAVVLGLASLVGAGCYYIRKQNTEAANIVASKYFGRLDRANAYLVEGDISKAKSVAIRTLNDIHSEKKNYDVNFGGYGGDLPDLERDLEQIASYK